MPSSDNGSWSAGLCQTILPFHLGYLSKETESWISLNISLNLPALSLRQVLTISQFSWVRDKAFQSKDYLRGMKWPASRLHHSNGVRSKYKGLVTGFETNLQASVYQTRAISMEEPACRPATKEQESLIQSPMSSTSHLGSRKRVLVRRLEYYGSHPVTSLVTHTLN